eukprot:CAMPEP_0194227054 /NCGR_PEP_ID=MMETSP0156-20130528/42660_1 /TAXON_ID=33649 /ORGANISM="Thalassionema nitzschioides, Strain L26-B" /LENGTH=350 /DNA_ID=CAMNT_0038959527 /DNA_START=59 /DNA_END=1111 /DNA_ORIENTATION=-
MGSNQSSHANAKTMEEIPSSKQLKSSESARGRKSLNSDIEVTPKTRSVDDDALFVYTSDSDESEGIEDDDEEIEAGLAERRMILEEAKMLKAYATFHLHPEKPVAITDANACGRNYFTRASAPEQETVEVAEERAMILEEASMLKKYAEFHLHPEKPVVTTDVNACGRNYFTRASADEFYGTEDAAEREQILQECAELKKYAGYHLHPEKPVVTEDSMLSARCYYGRATAPEQETVEEAEERAMILEEVFMLKKYAEFHLHPERPVETTDANACGRNYFDRFSAANVVEPEAKSEENREPQEPVKLKSNTKLFQPAAKHASGDDGNKEEEGMTRSPSSIMLYGFEDNEAF